MTNPSLPTNGGVEACTSHSLTLSLGQANGTAGSVVYPLVFRNIGSVPCEMYGYPGVSLVSGTGHTQIGSAATRSPAVTPSVVTLAPGGRATAQLQVADAGNYPTSRCSPAPASGLLVYAPGDKTALYVGGNNLTACAAAGVSILSVQAVAAASGAAGASGTS